MLAKGLHYLTNRLYACIYEEHNMKKTALVLSLMAAPVASQAKFLFEINAGVGSWLVPEAKGVIEGATDEPFSIDSDSALSLTSDDNGVYFWADFSHPVPFIPEAKFRYQQLSNAGEGTIAADFLLDATFGEGANAIDLSNLASGLEDAKVTMDLDMSYMDFIVNFGLPIPMLDFDFGVNVRRTNFAIAATSDYATANDLSIGSYEQTLWFPMAYGALEFEIPTTGVSLGGEISILPLGGVGLNITDYQLKAKYFVPLPSDLLMRVGLEVAYHSYTFDMNGENVTFSDELKPYKANLAHKGLALGLVAQF